MADIGERMLLHGRLVRLPQLTVAAVFTHTSADTMLHGSNVKLGTWAGNSVDSTRRQRVSDVLRRPQGLMDFSCWLENRSYVLSNLPIRSITPWTLGNTTEPTLSHHIFMLTSPTSRSCNGQWRMEFYESTCLTCHINLMAWLVICIVLRIDYVFYYFLSQ